MDRTTPNHRRAIFAAPLVTFSAIFAVGTGGDYTPSYHALRSERGGAYSGARTVESLPKSNGFAIKHDIDQIQATLKLTMTELARSLGVSRQALYNWLAGGAIKDENFAKLAELRAAADVIGSANLDMPSRAVHRKLSGGKTLLEMIASGGNGAAGAGSLLALLNAEAEQRATLAEKFAGRHSSKLLGYGTPPLIDQS